MTQTQSRLQAPASEAHISFKQSFSRRKYFFKQIEVFENFPSLCRDSDFRRGGPNQGVWSEPTVCGLDIFCCSRVDNITFKFKALLWERSHRHHGDAGIPCRRNHIDCLPSLCGS